MKYFIWILLLAVSIQLPAQRTDHKLESRIENLIQGFHGVVGVYVHDLKKNKIVSISPDTVFPTASMVKLSILLGIMDKMDKGELDYHQRMTYTDSLYYDEGDDILASFKPGSTIELSKLLLLMLSCSDNTASLWLQGLAGGGTRINQILDSLGIKDYRVNSRTPGREAEREEYGWGQTTPRAMENVMERIAIKKDIFSPTACDKMLRMLGRQYWDEEALSQIPPGVFCADKNGAVDQSRSEVVYVNCHHPYIFCICTKNNQDTSWTYNNEAWVLTRKLSRMLWQYYNPKSTWTGAPVEEPAGQSTFLNKERVPQKPGEIAARF
ncbi:MAG: serine hydrolase [Bacteroidota bacterium]|nr:serine hydrolase [Bacteroidota bacterium]